MATITFDTLKYANRLEQSGIPREQAAAMAEAQREAFAEIMESQLATKADIARVEQRLIEHDGEFKLIRWMLGILLAGTLSLILKAFF